ncbi:hypothetical protein ASH01_17045 [Terrabacter sp. Soil811]|nr:hypothetical protein ASH01_17045 [Terrabacter sp. Soil811]
MACTYDCQWVRLMSGLTTCSRDPSGSVASTNGLAQVELPPAAHEHPLEEVADVVGGEDGGRQLCDAASCDEDPVRVAALDA